MTLATDGQLLLAAILAHPEDDDPRLQYADWLDENGQPERAEFVRVQCELARLEDRTGTSFTRTLRIDALRRRERELIKSWWEWVPDCIPSQAACLLNLNPTHSGPAVVAMFARGFIASISCTLAVLFGGSCEMCERHPQLIRPRGKGIHGCPDCKGEGRTPGIAAELFRRQPVERVTLTDREPIGHDSDEWRWLIVGASSFVHPAFIPVELMPPLDQYGTFRRYPSRDAALAALSASAVRYGRQLAGLPHA